MNGTKSDADLLQQIETTWESMLQNICPEYGEEDNFFSPSLLEEELQKVLLSLREGVNNMNENIGGGISNSLVKLTPEQKKALPAVEKTLLQLGIINSDLRLSVHGAECFLPWLFDLYRTDFARDMAKELRKLKKARKA